MAARFWDLSANNCWVRLSLEEGQTISSFHHEPTEEGYSRTLITWERINSIIYRKTTDDGLDCDGRLTRTHIDFTFINKLKAIKVIDRSKTTTKISSIVFYRPDWKEYSQFQRDYTAEKAGY